MMSPKKEKKDTIKHIFLSILIGACVAFLSSLFDGILDIVRGYGNDVLGGVTATATYIKITLRV